MTFRIEENANWYLITSKFSDLISISENNLPMTRFSNDEFSQAKLSFKPYIEIGFSKANFQLSDNNIFNVDFKLEYDAGNLTPNWIDDLDTIGYQLVNILKAESSIFQDDFVNIGRDNWKLQQGNYDFYFTLSLIMDYFVMANLKNDLLSATNMPRTGVVDYKEMARKNLKKVEEAWNIIEEKILSMDLVGKSKPVFIS